MNVNDTRIRFEVEYPGDDGHVTHRVAETLKALMAVGLRISARLDNGRVYLLADNEDPVDSSTVDGPWNEDGTIKPGRRAEESAPIIESGPFAGWRELGSTPDPAPIPAVRRSLTDTGSTPALDAVSQNTCGIAACGHPRSAHRERTDGEPEPVAGRGPRKAADIPVLCATPIAPGVPCPCPGFTPITVRPAAPGLFKPGPY